MSDIYNTFDGSDSCKLQPFLVQCNLNFRDRPDTFSSNSLKVVYILSYLKGTTLDWFEPMLSLDIDPSWIDDYPKFVSKLKDNFGPHDPIGKAGANLETLHMCDNQQVTKYLVEFNHLAVCVHWGDAALCHQFYNGLLARIKDKVAHVGKPNMLHELCTLTQSINACYWERCSEVAPESNSNKASD